MEVSTLAVLGLGLSQSVTTVILVAGVFNTMHLILFMLYSPCTF